MRKESRFEPFVYLYKKKLCGNDNHRVFLLGVTALKKVLKVVFWVVFSFGLVMAASIMAGGLYMSFAERVEQESRSAQRLAAKVEDIPSVTVERESRSMADMIEEALPSVVGISTSAADGAGNSSWYMGSGVIVTDNGYIITNQHVIGGSSEEIIVTLYNGTTRQARKIWSDSALDLAVIKVDGERYTIATLGDAEKLRVGENVVAIGNPLSMQFERTVTAGIVSALNRTITVDNGGVPGYMEDLIQTDASINPGNSGGPLINAAGEVVGINTIKVSAAEGMGFAIPINLCIPVVERIKNLGEFKTPYLGLYAYTSEAARYVKKVTGFNRGLYIVQLDPTGPAFKAGLRYGDIIVYVDGKEINSMLSLRRQLFTHQPGETITISFLRDDSLREAIITLSGKEG